MVVSVKQINFSDVILVKMWKREDTTLRSWKKFHIADFWAN